MSSVVNLTAERERRETEAWERYVAARNRADETLLVEDGTQAARAWCAFLSLFLTEAQAEFMGGSVVSMRRRA